MTTRETLEQSSAASKLLAGGNIVVDTDTLDNNYSQIAANGDITLSAANVTNSGRDLIETVETTAVTHHSQRYCARRILGVCVKRKTRRWTTSEYDTTSSTYDAAYASIEAGGTLDANVSGYLENEAVRASAGQIGISSGSRALDLVGVNNNGGSADRFDLGAKDADLDAILDRSALFEEAQDP